MRNVVNIVLYTSGWWSAVFLVQRDLHMETALLLSFIVLLQFHFVMHWDRRLVLGSFLVGVIGFTADFMAQHFGLLSFGPGHPPIWLFTLWVCFAATFPIGLQGLAKPLWLPILLGGIGGPLTYWAAQSFSILQFQEPRFRNVILYGLLWAILFPALFYVWEKMKWTSKIKTS